MNAIFLGEQPLTIHQVYSAKFLADIKMHIEIDGKVYDALSIEKQQTVFKEVEIIFSTWGMCRLTSDQIQEIFPKLKIVFYAAGSVQYFARPFLDNGIIVVSAWMANAIPVAEFTVSQIILANKGYFKIMQNNRMRQSETYDYMQSIRGNYGCNIGILGAGMIGKNVIRLLKNFRFNVFVFDPFLSDRQAEELEVTKKSLQEIFACCHIITNHMADNEKTKKMITGDLFERMPENSVFVNTGRGSTVDEPAMIESLNKRTDIIALLDVVVEDDNRNNEEKLKEMNNVILTPHIAGSLADELFRMSDYMYDDCLRYLAGDLLKYRVTTEMLEYMA